MEVKENEGKTDRIIRIVLGVIAVILGYLYSPWFYILALVLIFTGAIGYCFIYEIFNFSTAKKKKK